MHDRWLCALIWLCSPIQIWTSCCFFVPSTGRNVKALRGLDFNWTNDYSILVMYFYIWDQKINIFNSLNWLNPGSYGLWLQTCQFHDNFIKWKHFPRYWPFVQGIHWSTVNSPRKGQWCVALMFSLICIWINVWVNNREADDLRRHYDIIVMMTRNEICNMMIQ